MRISKCFVLAWLLVWGNGFESSGAVAGHVGDFCPVSAVASGKWEGRVGGPDEAVNGAGLTADRHGPAIADNWMQPGAGGDDAAWLVLDLQGRCDLQELVLWNYFEFGGSQQQNATLPNRGIATADIYIATAGSGAQIPMHFSGPFDFQAAGWKRIRAGQKFHKAPAARSAEDTTGPTDIVDLTGHRGVTHVALVGMKHFGPDAFGRYVGLSEVQIVPVAGTYVERPDSPRAKLRAEIGRAVDFNKLAFIRRYTYQSTHIYTDHYDGSTMPGGNLCILSPVAPEGEVTELVPELRGGIIGNFDLSYDAERIVFSYKPSNDRGYRIFQVAVDGSGLRQLTHDGPDEASLFSRYGHGYDDLDPCYLPNGEIAFTSTRPKRAVLCTHNFTSTSLHVMDADGGNVRCISGNTINEFTPTVMHDGRMLYTRWEYVDKGAGDVQSLWCVHPDGSGAAHVYKNNLSRPSAMMDARCIPGSHKIVATGAPHMPLAVGSVLVVDIRISQQRATAMTNLTPRIGLPPHFGWPNPRAGFYATPYPLSENLFLVSYCSGPKHDDPGGYAIYYLGSSGSRQLVYRDREYSCFRPTPLRPRPVPPVIPPAGEVVSTPGGGDAQPCHAEEIATLFLEDVYAGMTGIERGRVKYLRVMEDVPKPWHASWVSPERDDSIGLQHPAVSLDGHYAVKKVHGIVPVRADGSALFTVPAGKNLYFQALDEQFMELQRMRTFVNLMPGETRSCVGCHESRRMAALPRDALPMALKEDPRALVPQPGDMGSRTVHYPTDVQPVLDRHCTSCHSGAAPHATLDLSGEMTTLFSRSYESLIRRNLVNKIDVTPRDAYIPAVPPLTFGSHRSKMIDRIRREGSPCNVGLSPGEFIKLVTWIDANAPYYGTYEGKRNLKWKNDPGFRPDP